MVAVKPQLPQVGECPKCVRLVGMKQNEKEEVAQLGSLKKTADFYLLMWNGK